MSEGYRKKSYYRPRVLIGMDDTLESNFPAIFLCLEGSELNILRNIMQYAERRVNWVAEYHDDYYLTPNDTDWDTIESLVAGLEEKLMGCDEWTTLFEDMLAAMQCVCDAASLAPRVSPGVQPVIENYLDAGTLQEADDYGGDTVVDAERCAIAQLNFAMAYEFLTEVLQPIQDVSTDVLMPAVLVMLAELCGAAVLGIPTGALLATIWQLVEVWEAGQLEHVQNEYVAYKEELVCAVYTGLADNYRTAENLAVEVIQSMDLSPIEMILLHCCYCPWVMGACKTAYDNGTDWAIANVIEGYCLICEELPEGNLFAWNWPPCPLEVFTDGGVCWSGWLCFNGAITPATQGVIVTKESYTQVTIVCHWYSEYGIGWTVGAVDVERWDTALQAWLPVSMLSATNTMPPGDLNMGFNTVPVSRDGGLHRIRLEGMPAQGGEEPYPFEVKLLSVEFA